MNERQNISPAIEPERYELRGARAYVFDLTRRDLFKFLGAGALILCTNTKTSAFQESGRGQRRMDDMPKDIGAWLHIGEDGAVTAFTGKVEVGQNIRTSLTQAVAEELGVRTSQIKVVMGDTLLTPFDMGTFGSRTTPIMNVQLRKAAAAARGLLKDLAAETWNVPREHLVAADGKISDPLSKNSGSTASGDRMETRRPYPLKSRRPRVCHRRSQISVRSKAPRNVVRQSRPPF